MTVENTLKNEFDDVVKDSNGHEWSQICKGCVEAIGLEESSLDDAGTGTCGVKGCENEADFYIDFEYRKEWLRDAVCRELKTKIWNGEIEMNEELLKKEIVFDKNKLHVGKAIEVIEDSAQNNTPIRYHAILTSVELDKIVFEYFDSENEEMRWGKLHLYDLSNEIHGGWVIKLIN